MAIFTEALKKEILNAEGGLNNRLNDYGGETKYGISKKQFPDEDIKNLTVDKAFSIYEKYYWNRYRLFEIENQAISEKIFMCIINMNPLNAIRCVQLAVEHYGKRVLIDGVLGSRTIAAINSLPPEPLLDRIRVELCKYYARVAYLDKTQLDYLIGWIRRATS